MNKPEQLSEQDRKAIEDAAKNTFPNSYANRVGFREGMKQGILYARAGWGEFYDTWQRRIKELETELEQLYKEGSTMSANQCLHGIHGDDWGNSYCPRIKELEAEVDVLKLNVSQRIDEETELRAEVTRLKEQSHVQYCDQCDGCGWYEGGPTLKTICQYCQGTGIKPKP